MPFESVEISQKDYPNFNYLEKNRNRERYQLLIPSKRRATKSDPFFSVSSITYLKNGHLVVARYEESIIRRNDNKTLAKKVHYFRRGGDLPIGFHSSSYACDKIDETNVFFSRTISII